MLLGEHVDIVSRVKTSVLHVQAAGIASRRARDRAVDGIIWFQHDDIFNLERFRCIPDALEEWPRMPAIICWGAEGEHAAFHLAKFGIVLAAVRHDVNRSSRKEFLDLSNLIDHGLWVSEDVHVEAILFLFLRCHGGRWWRRRWRWWWRWRCWCWHHCNSLRLWHSERCRGCWCCPIATCCVGLGLLCPATHCAEPHEEPTTETALTSRVSIE
mmetsp:Transcript_47658/g.102055  ORF Transcript_47658/g.102055 Transcript_47658/m.102055 type:complete len:213 (+) Transcript_47658:685-1323(+)